MISRGWTSFSMSDGGNTSKVFARRRIPHPAISAPLRWEVDVIRKLRNALHHSDRRHVDVHARHAIGLIVMSHYANRYGRTLGIIALSQCKAGGQIHLTPSGAGVDWYAETRSRQPLSLMRDGTSSNHHDMSSIATCTASRLYETQVSDETLYAWIFSFRMPFRVTASAANLLIPSDSLCTAMVSSLKSKRNRLSSFK